MSNWVAIGTGIAAAPAVAKLMTALANTAAGLAAPWQIERVEAAKTRAEANRIVMLASATVEARDIETRAAYRVASQEIRRQENLEAIRDAAIPKLPDGDVSKEPVDPDWMARFLDAAQDVSDEQLREVYATLLADEVVRPGRISRRTLSIVNNFSRRDAEAFARLAALVWTEGDTCVALAPHVDGRLTSNPASEGFSKLGVSESVIREFEACGLLVSRGATRTTSWLPSGPETRLTYYGETIAVANGKSGRGPADVDRLEFTASGAELARVAAGSRDTTYHVEMLKYFQEKGLDIQFFINPPKAEQQ